jgi:hypothetical protein
MSDELESIWREAVLNLIEVPSWNFPGGTEENRQNLPSGQLMFIPRFQLIAS